MVRKKKFKLEWRVKKKPDAPPPPWIDLPRDITTNILNRLGAIEILESAQKVCTTWRSVCKDPHMWRVIHLKTSPDRYEMREKLEIMCRHAVDRSHGQLTDLSIENFGSNDLLDYISERSSQLKHIRLACCDKISGEGLSHAVKKLPQLSELHFFHGQSISGRDIEAIARACPLLKSFSLNNRLYKFPLIVLKNNEQALAVAKNMHGLHCLRLFGNGMTNEGLEAILVGCPQLESLDIRQCRNVDLSDLTGDLGKRCALQIRELRGPNDSDADYELEAILNYDNYDAYSSEYSDDFFGHVYDWSIGDYDDYTNPFNSEYFSDSDAWLFDTLTINEFDHDDYM